MSKKTYQIYPSTIEDISNGWIWISVPDLDQRGVAKIKNIKENKTTYCEVLLIDPNYRKYYSTGNRRDIQSIIDPIIIINYWYRKELGINESNKKVELEITIKNCLCYKIRACLHHPQAIVKIATWLAIISIFIGIIGIILSFVR